MAANAQLVVVPDTLTVMQYNLTNYGNFNIPGCTSLNNGLTVKDANLRVTINYARPDVFGVNELARNPILADRIINNVLNTGGRRYYARAQGSNLGFEDIISQIYYNSQKLAIASEHGIQTNLRDILHVRFYALPVEIDTAYINFYVGHLKAGSAPSDAASRDQEATSLLAYFNTRSRGEQSIFMGDLNVYTISEAF